MEFLYKVISISGLETMTLLGSVLTGIVSTSTFTLYFTETKRRKHLDMVDMFKPVAVDFFFLMDCKC